MISQDNATHVTNQAGTQGQLNPLTDHERSLERAGDAGRSAYGRGVSIQDNPYPETDPLHEFWSGGWEDGMHAAPSQADINDAGSRETTAEPLDQKLLKMTLRHVVAVI